MKLLNLLGDKIILEVSEKIKGQLLKKFKEKANHIEDRIWDFSNL